MEVAAWLYIASCKVVQVYARIYSCTSKFTFSQPHTRTLSDNKMKWKDKNNKQTNKHLIDNNGNSILAIPSLHDDIFKWVHQFLDLWSRANAQCTFIMYCIVNILHFYAANPSQSARCEGVTILPQIFVCNMKSRKSKIKRKKKHSRNSECIKWMAKIESYMYECVSSHFGHTRNSLSISLTLSTNIHLLRLCCTMHSIVPLPFLFVYLF